MKLEHVSDEQVVLGLGQLAARERQALVDFLEYLIEFDRRRLHLRQGYSSLFAYLTSKLRYCNGSAYRRMTAARLMAEKPETADLLRSGELSLKGLCLLKDVLSDEVLEQARGKTEEEIALLVATLRPQQPTLDLLRRLPERRVNVENTSPGEVTEPTPPPAKIAPISAKLRLLKVTVDQEFVDDLEELKNALSQKIPKGELSKVLHEAIRVALKIVEKKKKGAEQKTEATGRSDTRYVPTAVRREVWERDGGSCTFRSNDGRRCGGKRKLELHHMKPFALGGLATADNLTIHCKAHNQLIAHEELGPLSG